jgi:hypothetical protein
MRSLPFFVSLLVGVGGCDPSAESPNVAPVEAEPPKADSPLVAQAEPEHDEGCIHEKKEDGSCAAAEVPEASSGHFGAPFALETSRPLAEVVADVENVGDAAVLVSGTVDKVCQSKGCWMVIKDGDANARILMKDHAFAIPFDGAGKAAKVEGTLEVRTFSEAQVKHLEKDGGGDPDAVEGQRTEVTMTASAVELIQS